MEKKYSIIIDTDGDDGITIIFRNNKTQEDQVLDVHIGKATLGLEEHEHPLAEDVEVIDYLNNPIE